VKRLEKARARTSTPKEYTEVFIFVCG